MTSYNPYQIQQILERTAWTPNLVPASNREWWSTIRERTNPAHFEALMADAERALTELPAAMPASLYLAFRETGDRKAFEARVHARGRAVAALAFAECVTFDGRYLTALQDHIWAVCEQSTWSYPAHLPDLPDPARPHIDLSAAMTALALSDVFILLGDRFDPGVARRIRHEIDTRIWTPYLQRHDIHWQGNWLERKINNWTAVCTAGVLGSAINMNVEPERLAPIIDRGLRSLDEYLATFDPDGGSTEGPGYWDYGFGYYSIIAQLLAQRTGGRIDLFEQPQVREIAQFPLRTRLSPGHYVTYSDCGLGVQMEPALLELLAQRLDLPELRALAPDPHVPSNGVRGLTWHIRDVHWRDPQPSAVDAPLDGHVWFRGMHWMIARDRESGLTLAIKGGHNAEMHNQNDVGSVIVHIDGESLVNDIGRGKYTRQYFGPERYHHLVNRSRGHSVPLVAGTEQPVGRDTAATVVTREHTAERDRLVLDMTAAYPDGGLASLTREAVLDRTTHEVILTDSFAFADGPAGFESVLISLATIEPGGDHVVIRGERNALRIGFDPQAVSFALDTVPDVDLEAGPADVHRLCFSPLEPVQTGEVRLTMGIAS